MHKSMYARHVLCDLIGLNLLVLIAQNKLKILPRVINVCTLPTCIYCNHSSWLQAIVQHKTERERERAVLDTASMVYGQNKHLFYTTYVARVGGIGNGWERRETAATTSAFRFTLERHQTSRKSYRCVTRLSRREIRRQESLLINKITNEESSNKQKCDEDGDVRLFNYTKGIGSDGNDAPKGRRPPSLHGLDARYFRIQPRHAANNETAMGRIDKLIFVRRKIMAA